MDSQRSAENAESGVQKRYWCPRDGRIVFDDLGFVADPEDWIGKAQNPDLRTFEELESIRCLVLLGEAGIGKSYTISEIVSSLASKIDATSEQAVMVDLGEYGDEGRLVDELFRGSWWSEWQASSRRLQLVIDGFDECHNRIQTLPIILANQLTKLPGACLERLYLRIACRTAAWPTSLEESLETVFGQKDIGVFELAPLRRTDVESIAQSNSIDAAAFVRDVIGSSAVPFAIKPVTLNLLIKLFGQSQHLPTSIRELYLEGCRHLCQEPRRREDSGASGNLGADQRLFCASWIASALFFGNKVAVATHSDAASTEAIPISDLSISGTQLQSGISDITMDGIRESLQTGIFTARGKDLFGPAHYSYAEFLVGRFVSRLGPLRAIDLIRHPGDPDQKTAPHLRGVAAWLAGEQAAVCEFLLKTDPWLLLYADVGNANPEMKVRLVECLVKSSGTNTGVDIHGLVDGQLRQLKHEGLGDQLLAFIRNKEIDVRGREFAIKVGMACREFGLSGELVRIARDPEEAEHLKVQAILGLNVLGNSSEKSELKPLLASQQDDPDDEVKGAALSLLWPEHLEAAELFESLTPPKRGSLIGLYALFLGRLFSDGMKPTDLPAALNWVAIQPPEHQMSSSFWHPVRKILAEAWEHLDYPGVVEALAETLAARLSKYEYELTPVDDDKHQSIPQAEERRHKVAFSLLSVLAREAQDPYALAFGHAPLVLIADLPWLLDTLDHRTEDAEKKATCALIETLFRGGSAALLELVFPYAQRHPLLAEALRPHVGPIDIDSPLADAQRQRLATEKKWEEMAARPKKQKPNPLALVRESLKKLDAGETNEWWVMTVRMIGDVGDMVDESPFQPDIARLAVWRKLSEFEIQHIVEHARKYVAVGDPSPSEWLGKNIHYWPAIAGYKALHLLHSVDQANIEALSVDDWKKWSPIIVGYPTDSFVGDNQTRRKLVSLAYRNAPSEVVASLRAMIEKENDEHGLMPTAVMFEDCLDENLESFFIDLIAADVLTPRSAATILMMLLQKESLRALQFARASIQLPESPTNRQLEMGVLCATTLAMVRKDGDWNRVWSAIMRNGEMAQAVVARLSDDDHHTGRVAKKLDEAQLADLYKWLLEHYPPEDDPQFDGTHCVSTREEIGSWRNSIIQDLASRSTRESVARLTEIAQAFPERKWLERFAKQSAESMLAKTWTPITPRQLAELSSDSRKRLVRNADELMEVVMEALVAIQGRLDGLVSEKQFLWDDKGSGVWQPKLEAALSDWVKLRLDEELLSRGIVLNREVQIRRGNKTDIHVNAVRKAEGDAGYDVCTLIIEVKGCWHDELDSAMESQLVGEYLKGSGCSHGIYLVGWFNCEKWTDTRNKLRAAMTIQEIDAQLESQAKALSVSGNSLRSFVLDGRL